MDKLLEAFTALDKLPLILGLAVLVLGFMLYKAHFSDSTFDLKDLIVDSKTNRVSLNKFGQFIALVMSSWGFLYLALNGKLTEVYFTTYMAAWSGITALSKAITAYETKGGIGSSTNYPNQGNQGYNPGGGYQPPPRNYPPSSYSGPTSKRTAVGIDDDDVSGLPPRK